MRTLARTSVLSLFAAVALAGCGEEGSRGDGFRIETFDGVSHSVAEPMPIEQGPVLEPAWEAPREAELLDGTEWSNPTQIYAYDQGVVVADPQITRVHLFRPEGARAGSFGRRGDGPGELQGALMLAAWGDTVFVQSGGRPAIQLFRSSGEHLGAIGQTEAMSFGFIFLPGRGFLRSLFLPRAGQAENRWNLLALDGESTEVALPGPHPLQPQAEAGPESCWRRGPLGADLLELDCTTPLVRVVDPTGTVLREHRIDRGPIDATSGMLRRMVDYRRDAMVPSLRDVPAAQRETLNRVIEEMIRQTEATRWIPVMRGVAGSPSGHRIVLWEQWPQEFEPDESVLHFLDGEGRYLLREPVNASLAAVAVSDEHVYLLRIDPDTGLRRLVAYPLPD